MTRNYFSIRWFAVVLAAFFVLSTGGTAHAVLKAPFGPPAPGTQGFPTWYQDTNGLSLGPCWDFNGFCTLLPPFCPPTLGLGCIGTPINLNPAVPINGTNFPIETFYFDATTNMSVGPAGGAKLVQVIALEGSFGGLPVTVAPGNQTTFLVINTRVTGAAGSLAPNATYTVTHPYGQYTFTSDATGAPTKPLGTGVFRAVDGCAAAPCDFSLLIPATTTGVGPWLVDANGLHTDPATGNVYIGPGPLSTVPVIGSPLGALRNNVTVTGPNAGGVGINTLTNPFFFLTGKVVGITASPGSITFPTQKPAATSAAVTVTITNPDTVNAASLGAAAKAGANPADFIIGADTCSGNPNIPAGGGTCSFSVTFSEPTLGAVNGPKSAVISFPVTAPLNKPPVIINLSGAIDNIPPTVVSTVPANKAINVPANNALVANFSEPVTGVDQTTFTLSGGTPVTAVTGTVGLDATGKIATFFPSADLQSDQTYTATLTSVITDIATNPLGTVSFSFATTAPNLTAPHVISTTPANNSTGARLTDPITATFDVAISVNPLTINATTFTLSEGVTGSVSYDQATRTATFTPAQPLTSFHSYTATITTGVKSLGQISMATPYTWTFFTNGAPDAPELLSPAEGEKVAGTTVDLQWLKSTDKDNEAVTYHVWYCTNPGMVGCSPIDATVTSSLKLKDTLAGLGGYGAGILLAGIAIVGGVRSRRKLFFFIAVVLISGMVATACGKKSDNNPGTDPALIATQHVTGLHAGSTYYWKIVADDGNGSQVPSETRSFATQ